MGLALAGAIAGAVSGLTRALVGAGSPHKESFADALAVAESRHGAAAAIERQRDIDRLADRLSDLPITGAEARSLAERYITLLEKFNSGAAPADKTRLDKATSQFIDEVSGDFMFSPVDKAALERAVKGYAAV